MGWRDLISIPETLPFPWVGGRDLRKGVQIWRIEGNLPLAHGWAVFECHNNRTAKWLGSWEPETFLLTRLVEGYLVGNRLVTDDARVDPDPAKIASQAEEVFLVERGLDSFVRISAGRMFDGAPLIFRQQEMGKGVESEVQDAFLDGKTDVNHVKGVTPALEAAFRMEVWQRQEADRRRREAAERRRAEEERVAREQRRKELVEKLGDGAGRRKMAVEDFAEAAKAALAVSGATYLDHRVARHHHEIVVRFRLASRRFECTCDDRTLQIIDSGICLTAHYDDPEFEGGTKGDNFFTLESLPAVILEAERDGKLVVYRHVD